MDKHGVMWVFVFSIMLRVLILQLTSKFWVLLILSYTFLFPYTRVYGFFRGRCSDLLVILSLLCVRFLGCSVRGLAVVSGVFLRASGPRVCSRLLTQFSVL